MIKIFEITITQGMVIYKFNLNTFYSTNFWKKKKVSLFFKSEIILNRMISLKSEEIICYLEIFESKSNMYLLSEE